jgi:hypothetical protein
MKQRTVKQGKQDFNPEHKRQFKLRFGWKKPRQCKLTFRIPADAWFEVPKNYSILKLGGITFFRPNSLLPNQDAALVGFKPAQEEGKFEVYSYINFTDKTWQFGKPIIVDAEQEITVSILAKQDTIYYSYHIAKEFIREDFFASFISEHYNDLRKKVETYSTKEKFPNYTGIMYNVSPFHGGNKTVTAPKTYSIYTEINSK